MLYHLFKKKLRSIRVYKIFNFTLHSLRYTLMGGGGDVDNPYGQTNLEFNISETKFLCIIC